MPMPTILEREALISPCGRYMYSLNRLWDRSRPAALVVMLNPSIADAVIDDPTIRSLVRLMDFHGYGSFEVMNLFALRTSDPKVLRRAFEPVGPRNKEFLASAVRAHKTVICAWGEDPVARWAVELVLVPAHHHQIELQCFGTNEDGSPKHPLYLSSVTPLRCWKTNT